MSDNQNKFLGMSLCTAAGRLRKMITFDLLKQLNEDFCFRCGKRIEYIKDLSIDHKKFWMGIDRALFWDLNNIAFSHLKCNTLNGKQKKPAIINGKRITRKDRDAFIGMVFGTATHRFRKIIMFDLVKRLNLDLCYRCGNFIKKIENFSIEHKKSWLHKDVNLFWDLNNIAFSHLKCNLKNKPRNNLETLGEDCEEGFHWCSIHKKCLPIELFGKDSKRYSGLRTHCKECRREEYRNYYSRIKIERKKNQMENMTCEHRNYILAGYPENIYGREYVRAQSMYDVYCEDCKNFVSLLTGEIINNKGLIVDKR